MHIIIDATSTQDQLAYAGPGQYTKNIILSLVKEHPKTSFSLLLYNNKETTLGKIEEYDNVVVEDIGGYKINDYKNDIWYYLKVLPLVKKIKQKDSIYFCPYFWRNYPSFSLPTVLFVHDMNLAIFNMYSQISPLHNIIRGVQFWMTMYKSLACKQLVFNSTTSKNDYTKYFPTYPKQNMHVSYLGVDLEEKEVSLDSVLPKDYKRRGYLLYLGGGINKSKNSIGVLHGYLEFLKLLNSKRGTVKKDIPYLVIAGGKFEDRSKKEVKELHDFISREGIEESVLFTGHYQDEEKYSLLKNSFAFIHLSLYEGFGISATEALRSKTPAILHKSPVYMELFKDVAIMVDGENKEEVGEKIYDVYINRDSYQGMVEKGYTLSKEFSWADVSRKTHDVFEKTLG